MCAIISEIQNPLWMLERRQAGWSAVFQRSVLGWMAGWIREEGCVCVCMHVCEVKSEIHQTTCYGRTRGRRRRVLCVQEKKKASDTEYLSGDAVSHTQ